MPPVGSKSGAAELLGLALDPALPPAQATASIASEMNNVRNMSVLPLWRPSGGRRSIAEGRSRPQGL
ncbi:MAG: hypothetical protein ACXU88_16395 [Myxococcaceae bacterium]